MKTITIANDILFGEVTRLVAEGQAVSFRTKGSSMLPFIHGDRDSVRIEGRNEYHVSEIVLCRLENGNYVLHRIIGIDSERVTLQGDGNIRGTESCPTRNIIGVVTAIITPDGREHVPSSGRIWRRLKPVRRYLLAIYRRLPRF